MRDWNGREIAGAESAGGVVLVADFADNLIRDDSRPWPPPPIIQKLYESRHGARLAEPVQAVVSDRLGFYSDLQSLHSEDAITWSFFGPLSTAAAETRVEFLNWLVSLLGEQLPTSSSCTIDLWRRVPHPDKPLPGGPELDFVLDGDSCVVFGEAKWLSGEGAQQGRAKDKGQLQLRREFFEKYGHRMYGERAFVVLGVDLGGVLREQVVDDADGGVIGGVVTWEALTEFDGHPKGEEFGRYLNWKREHSRLPPAPPTGS